MKPDCALCTDHGGELIWQSRLYRVILANEPDYPGFCRVILNRHAAEMTDLEEAEQAHLLKTVLTVEKVIRRELSPDKINLASLGNVVPHVHWHVIPRWQNDRHFPNPVWGEAKRDVPPRPVDLTGLKAAIASALLMQESLEPAQ